MEAAALTLHVLTLGLRQTHATAIYTTFRQPILIQTVLLLTIVLLLMEAVVATQHAHTLALRPILATAIYTISHQPTVRQIAHQSTTA